MENRVLPSSKTTSIVMERRGWYREWKLRFPSLHRREGSLHHVFFLRSSSDREVVALVLEGRVSAAVRDGVSVGGGEEMKVYVPFRRADPPELSEEEISRLMEGRYVEGEFGLDEGDVFTVRYEGERFEAFCYRTVDPGRCRVRMKGRGRKVSTYSETPSKLLYCLA